MTPQELRVKLAEMRNTVNGISMTSLLLSKNMGQFIDDLDENKLFLNAMLDRELMPSMPGFLTSLSMYVDLINKFSDQAAHLSDCMDGGISYE